MSFFGEMHKKWWAMKMRYGLLAIGCLGLSLSSCVDNQIESALSSSTYRRSSTIGSLPSSSSSAESSGKESMALGSSYESSAKPESSGSQTIYYTVSIYQSYYIEDERSYGNPRFDTSVTREAGQLLCKDIKESHDLEGLCRPDYHALGQFYLMSAFYIDEKCSKCVSADFVVNADISIYYYCYD